MSDQPRKTNILVVDDERGARLALEVPLRLSGYEVTAVAGGREAVSLARRQHFDIVLTDIYMPDLNGLEVISEIRQACPATRIIAVTAQGSLEIALQAIEKGAFDFIAKPYALEEMLALVNRATTHAQAVPVADPFVAGDFSRSGLIGHSPEMVKAYKLTAYAARTSATVLIEGESGTGKELIARAIHFHSRRASRPFTAVNCSALTDTLLESELFGYTKGSFTGANSDHPGLFESSDGGTIFLDELAGTSPSFQASLLRVLQEREVRRLGSREARKIDVRVIGATNQSLEVLVERGDFRADLFYRLSVLTILLPPLRARGVDDITLLTHHFLRKHNQPGEEPLQISAAALELLSSYVWPGNVRELENTIEHAAAICADHLITLNDIPARIVERVGPVVARSYAPVASLPVASLIDDRPTLAELERRYVQLTLAELDGNKSRAAERLGIDRRTIYRFIEQQDVSE